MSHRSLHPARAPGSNDSIKPEFKDVRGGIRRGEGLAVAVLITKGISCQTSLELNGGTEENFDSSDATSNGERKVEVNIPSGAKIGTASIHTKVTDDQNLAQDHHDIEVKK